MAVTPSWREFVYVFKQSFVPLRRELFGFLSSLVVIPWNTLWCRGNGRGVFKWKPVAMNGRKCMHAQHYRYPMVDATNDDYYHRRDITIIDILLWGWNFEEI